MPKTLTNAPKPRSLDDFERHGLGHDTKPQAPKEDTKRLSLDLPVSLHRRFKNACTNADTSMVDKAIALIERWIAEQPA